MSGYLNLLKRNPGYTRLWLAQAVSLLGDWFATIVLLALVTRNSPPEQQGLAITLLLLSRFLPPLIVSPFAGVLVDRVNRRRLLIVSDLLRAGTALLFLLALDPARTWLIYPVTAIQFAIMAVFEPGRSALVPGVTRPEDLVLANTLGSITWSVMLAAGGAIGGLVAGLIGTPFALLVDAGSFLVSALLLMQIRVPGDSAASGARVFRDKATFADGLRYLAAHPTTALVTLVKLGGSIGSVDVLMTIYATRYFVLGEDGLLSLGVLWSAYGLGAVLGPLLLNRFNDGTPRVMRRLVLAGYALIAVGWVLLGWAPSIAWTAVALIIKAMGGSVNWTYSAVILQKAVPDAYLGRAFSVDMAGFQLATVLSVVVVGSLVDTLGAPNARVIAFGTSLVALVPLALWALAVPWMERREAVPVAATD